VANEERTFLDPFAVDFDLEEGAMPGAQNILRRNASAMRGHYKDEDALERLIADGDDPLHYEVFMTPARKEFQGLPVPEEDGHLLFCLSKIQPGVVGQECFMTKGHYHTRPETAEIYLGLRGEGLVLMKTADGRFAAQPIPRGRMVYIPPYWAHRTVNTGDEPLLFYCVYPADAGHNYGDIEDQGFPKRVLRRGDKIEIV